MPGGVHPEIAVKDHEQHHGEKKRGQGPSHDGEDPGRVVEGRVPVDGRLGPQPDDERRREKIQLQGNGERIGLQVLTYI
jgi:hypothetical protein